MIFFTSDQHYWHANVIKYCDRPFASVEEMNEMMVIAYNMTVKPEDQVIHLGDFSMAFRAVETFPQRLLGDKILVPGNHDFCHSFHKKSQTEENHLKWIGKYQEHGFKVLEEQAVVHFDGLGTVNLCHHPYSDGSGTDEGDHTDKYAAWRPVDDGKILLCGHVHEKWKTKRSPKGTLMINVGVDQWGFAPVSLERIIELAKAEGAI